MTEPVPASDPAQPSAGETLLEITTPGDTSSPGATLLALDAGTGNESVLSRIERATGSNLSTRPIELKTGEVGPNPSQATTRGATANFTDRASAGLRTTARYVSAAELGRGGMGVVLKVRDADLRREVAMKVVRSDRAQPGTQNGNAVLRRFIEEAQITGQLEHPNIVPVHELGADADGRVYFTMKLVRGRPLNDVIKSLRAGDKATLDEYPLDRLLGVFMKVCDALSFAHAHNVIHRDLKPENIMLGRFGEVLVMDWGLARILNQPEAPGVEVTGGIETDSSQRRLEGDSRPSALSMEGTIAGTPAYMAPEQARGQVSRIDQTTDVFALGAILYELLILRPPYQGEGGTQIIERAAEGEIVPPAERAAKDPELRQRLARLPGGKVPPELEAIAMHALSYRQERRYPTAKALKEDVENYLAGRPVTVRQDPLPVRAAKWVRRHPTLSMSSAAAAAVILISVASIMFLVAQARKEALEQEGQLLATAKIAEDEAKKRALAEGETARRERELRDAAVAREQALARRAKAAEFFRVGTEQAERARDMMDPTLRDRAKAEATQTLRRAALTDHDYIDPWFALGRLHHFFFDQSALECYEKVDFLARQEGSRGDARSLVYAGDFARLHLQEVKQAREYYERASLIAPDDPLALVGRGYVDLLDGEFASALEHAQRSRTIDASLWEPYLLEGIVRASLFRKGERELNNLFDPALAEELLSQGLLRSSREGVLFNERGTARLELGRIADAHADFVRACELMPGAIEPVINLSISFMRQARLAESLMVIQRLIDDGTANVQAWMQFGTILLQVGRVDDGVAALNRSLELRPGRPAPLTNLSLAESWRMNFAQAESLALMAVASEPQYVTAYIVLCEARLGMKNFVGALEAADKALELRPDWAVAHIVRSKTLAYTGRFEEALEAARHAVKGQPESDDSWAVLGLAELGLLNLSTSAEHFEKALSLNPNNAMAILNLAIGLKRQGKVEQALPYAVRACDFHNLGARPLFEVGSCLLVLGRYAEALEKFLNAAEQEPDNGDAWINAALCANHLGDAKQARDHALQATRCRPDHVLSWVQLCQSEIYLKDFAAANRAVDRAKDCETNDPVERADVAAMLYTLGRHAEAIDLARVLAEESPQFARPLEILANTYIQLKRFEDALDARAEQARRDPSNPWPWESSAVLLYQLGRYEEAIGAGKKALALNGNSVMAHKFIGNARIELKQYDLAVESFEAANRADKADEWPWFNIGVARIRQNRITDAIAAFKESIARNSTNEQAWWTLGLCHKNQGQWPQALEAFRQTLRVNPRNAAAAQEGGFAALEAEDAEAAQELGQLATQLAPGQWFSWFVLGRAHIEQEQYTSAARAFTKATELESKQAILFRMLAVSLAETSDLAGAGAAADKCLALDPKDGFAALVKSRVALEHANEVDDALAWLRKALGHGVEPVLVFSQPWAKPLHETEGWKKLRQDFPEK